MTTANEYIQRLHTLVAEIREDPTNSLAHRRFADTVHSASRRAEELATSHPDSCVELNRTIHAMKQEVAGIRKRLREREAQSG